MEDTYLLNLRKGSKLFELFGVKDKEELQPNLQEIKCIFYRLLDLYLQKEKDHLLTCDKQWQNDCREQILRLLKIVPSNIKGIYFCGIQCGKREGRIYYCPRNFTVFFKKI